MHLKSVKLREKYSTFSVRIFGRIWGHRSHTVSERQNQEKAPESQFAQLAVPDVENVEIAIIQCQHFIASCLVSHTVDLTTTVVVPWPPQKVEWKLQSIEHRLNIDNYCRIDATTVETGKLRNEASVKKKLARKRKEIKFAEGGIRQNLRLPVARIKTLFSCK